LESQVNPIPFLKNSFSAMLISLGFHSVLGEL
jgi:hypothetical protein